MALNAGTRLGPYQIEAAIGAGGMGEVYRAVDTRLDRKVAVKVLPTVLASDGRFLATKLLRTDVTTRQALVVVSNWFDEVQARVK